MEWRVVPIITENKLLGISLEPMQSLVKASYQAFGFAPASRSIWTTSECPNEHALKGRKKILITSSTTESISILMKRIQAAVILGSYISTVRKEKLDHIFSSIAAGKVQSRRPPTCCVYKTNSANETLSRLIHLVQTYQFRSHSAESLVSSP